MKYSIGILILVLLLTGCSFVEEKQSYEKITMDEAMSFIEKENDYTILDVRTADEFKSGHIPGAMNIPNEEIGEDILSQLKEKEKTILVYCRSGNRSKQATEKLLKLGYSNVIDCGGIMDWKGEVVTEDGI